VDDAVGCYLAFRYLGIFRWYGYGHEPGKTENVSGMDDDAVENAPFPTQAWKPSPPSPPVEKKRKGRGFKLKLTIHDDGLDRRSHGAARNTNAVTIRSTN
jgi:hypothetical protein